MDHPEQALPRKGFPCSGRPEHPADTRNTAGYTRTTARTLRPVWRSGEDLGGASGRDCPAGRFCELGQW
jgi:hypothetical protein